MYVQFVTRRLCSHSSDERVRFYFHPQNLSAVCMYEHNCHIRDMWEQKSLFWMCRHLMSEFKWDEWFELLCWLVTMYRTKCKQHWWVKLYLHIHRLWNYQWGRKCRCAIKAFSVVYLTSCGKKRTGQNILACLKMHLEGTFNHNSRCMSDFSNALPCETDCCEYVQISPRLSER